MSTELASTLALAHPALGTITLLAAAWIASRGIVARQGSKASTAARRAHKRWAKWVFAAMCASGITGIASTVWLRPELTLGETWHLAVGLGAIGVMGAAGLLTQAFTRNPRLRLVHPWLGAASLALGIAQALLGIELLP